MSSYLVLEKKDGGSSYHALELALDGETTTSSYLLLVRVAIESHLNIGVCLRSCVHLIFSLLPPNVIPRHDLNFFGGRTLLSLYLDAIMNSYLDEGRHALGFLPHNT